MTFNGLYKDMQDDEFLHNFEKGLSPQIQREFIDFRKRFVNLLDIQLTNASRNLKIQGKIAQDISAASSKEDIILALSEVYKFAHENDRQMPSIGGNLNYAIITNGSVTSDIVVIP